MILAPASQRSSLDSMDELINRYRPESFLYTPFLPDAALAVLQANSNTSGSQFISLHRGQSITVADPFILKVLVVREEGTSVLIQYGNLRILMPGGVGYSELSQLAPEELRGFTILLLTHRDLLLDNHHSWYALPVQTILINTLDETCPPAHCRSTNSTGSIEISSDGETYWLTGDKKQ